METRMIEGYAVLTGRWPADSTKPTLIFIHGAALSKGLWRFQVEGLSDIANTVALDLPGHKDSSGEAFDSIAGYAASVMDFIASIRASRPILCGLSMGGAIAQELLIAHPDFFRAGILMHTGARLKVLPFVFETIQKDYASYFDLALEFTLSRKSDKSRMKEILSEITVMAPEVALKDFYACDAFDRMNDLVRIKPPVLVVAGGEDKLTPLRYAEYLNQNIKDCRMMTIPETGHLSPLEKPNTVNQAIRDFLISLEPGRSPESA